MYKKMLEMDMIWIRRRDAKKQKTKNKRQSRTNLNRNSKTMQ